MNDLRAAAEMALHALKFSQNMKRCFARAEQDYHEKIAPIAIEALRQALAQPEQAEYDKLTTKFGERAKEYLEEAKKSWEQEPVAWEKSYDIACALLRQAHDILATTQYPIKRPWVSLTDEEIDYIWGVTPPDYENFFEFPRAIESALRSKNT